MSRTANCCDCGREFEMGGNQKKTTPHLCCPECAKDRIDNAEQDFVADDGTVIKFKTVQRLPSVMVPLPSRRRNQKS